MKNLLIVMGGICMISTVQAYDYVQMPFPVGNAYACNQNSDDSFSHGRNDDNSVNKDDYVKTTLFDLDFFTPTGTIIAAATGGTVHRGNNPGGFGLYAKVDNGNDRWTMYAHLSGYIVKDGQHVVSGQPIAFSGNTGRSSAPHLHFGVHSGSGVGVSEKMEVQVIERDPNGNYLTEGWFATGLQGERRDFTCLNPYGDQGAPGNRYARVSTNDHNDFSNFECYALGDNNASNGILCWNGYTSGSLPTCTAGQNHVRYYKSNGVYKSESITDSSVLSQHCVNTYSNVHVGLVPKWLQGGSGVGGGSSSGGTVSEDPADADISIRKFWIREKGGSYTRAIDKTIFS